MDNKKRREIRLVWSEGWRRTGGESREIPDTTRLEETKGGRSLRGWLPGLARHAGRHTGTWRGGRAVLGQGERSQRSERGGRIPEDGGTVIPQAAEGETGRGRTEGGD